MTTFDTRPCVDVNSEAFKAALAAYESEPYITMAPNRAVNYPASKLVKLSTFLAAYIKADPLMSAVADGKVLEALTWIDREYENININHEDFRVQAKVLCNEILTAIQGNTP